MGNSILSQAVFRNTTPGLQGYSEAVATGATADPPSPNQGDNQLAPIAMQSMRDDAKTDLWSYVSPDNIETYASELVIQVSPEGMWDLGTSILDVRSKPVGKAVMKVNGTAVMELQVWARCTPTEPSMDSQTTNKGSWGANNYGDRSEDTTPKYADGISLAAGDTLSFEVTPYDHALSNAGLFPQVWRFKVFAQGSVSAQRFFWTAAYRPLDLSANQVAQTFTAPVNGIDIQSIMVYADASDPFVANRVELLYNGIVVHEFGGFNATIFRSVGGLISLPIEQKLGTGGTLALRGNPLIDCGGTVSVQLLGELTDLTEAPYAAGYADGYADGLADGLATDQTGPVVQNIAPTQGTVIGTNTSITPITFEVADTTGVLIANVDITIHFVDATSVNVWNGVALDAAYNASSSVVQTNGQLVTVSLLPDVGNWTQTIARIEVTADDTAGGPNSSDTVIGSWIVTVDDIGPIVQSIDPEQGTVIGAGSSSTPITFEIADAHGVAIADVVITVHLVDNTTIDVWDGAAIDPAFDAASTVVQTNANLVTVSIVPDADWDQTVSHIHVEATDGAVTPNTSTTTIGSWIVIGASKDTTPPTITAISPTPAVAAGDPGGFPNSSAAFTTPIIVEATDAFPGIVYESVTVRMFGVSGLDQDAEQVAFRAGSFKPPYDGTSEIVGDQLSILPADGWRGTYVVLEMDVIDIDGNLAHEELVYQLPTTARAIAAEAEAEEVDAVTAAINRLPAQFRSNDLP